MGNCCNTLRGKEKGGGHHDFMIAQCVTTGTGRRYDAESETLVPVTVDLGRTSDRIRVGAKVSATIQAGGGGSGAKSGLYLLPEPTLAVRTAQTSANGHGIAEEKAHTLDGANGQAVAVDCRNLREVAELSGTLQCKSTGGYSLNYQNPVRIGYAVRRLMPIECERLMSLPDNWTLIPGVGVFKTSDTARYKALGNSLVEIIARWILGRIRNVILYGHADGNSVQRR